MSIERTLEEREGRYGKFSDHARISQSIKNSLNDNGCSLLSDCQREALEMVAHKMARILSGDPDYIDNWHDIAGYATLVENELKANSVKLNRDNLSTGL